LETAKRNINISDIGFVQLKVEQSEKCRKYEVELAPGKACQHLLEHASSYGYKGNLLQAQKIPLEKGSAFGPWTARQNMVRICTNVRLVLLFPCNNMYLGLY
jgi:hypothetical protein